MTFSLHDNRNKASIDLEIEKLRDYSTGHVLDDSLKHILFSHIDTTICSPHDVCHFEKQKKLSFSLTNTKSIIFFETLHIYIGDHLKSHL